MIRRSTVLVFEIVLGVLALLAIPAAVLLWRLGSGPVEVNFLYADPDYAETFGLEFVQGRDFSRDIPADSTGAFLINESALRFLGFDDPLGKKLTLAGNEGEVIGVVKNFHFKPLIFEISPLVMAVRPDWYFDLLAKISPGEMPQTLAYIEDVFNEVTPGYPFDYSFIDDEFNALYKPMQFVNGIFNAFTVLAVFISCLGLFGLVSLLTEQRRKEVGIRKVLGASASGILILLSRKFILTVLAANLAAVPVSYFVTRQFLNLFAYRTDFNPLAILTVSLVTFTVALGTVGFNILKTAGVNPADCLRHE